MQTSRTKAGVHGYGRAAEGHLGSDRSSMFQAPQAISPRDDPGAEAPWSAKYHRSYGSQTLSNECLYMDRLLRPYRSRGIRKPISATRPGLLKNLVPVRTFADWDRHKPGFVEVDLVAHYGESASGFYLNTLCAVHLASGWTECLPVFSKYQHYVKQAIHHVRLRLPCPLRGMDSDKGT